MCRFSLENKKRDHLVSSLVFVICENFYYKQWLDKVFEYTLIFYNKAYLYQVPRFIFIIFIIFYNDVRHYWRWKKMIKTTFCSHCISKFICSLLTVNTFETFVSFLCGKSECIAHTNNSALDEFLARYWYCSKHTETRLNDRQIYGILEISL